MGVNATDVNRCSFYSWLDPCSTEYLATNPTNGLSLGWPADLRVAGLVDVGRRRRGSSHNLFNDADLLSDGASLNGGSLVWEYDIASNLS